MELVKRKPTIQKIYNENKKKRPQAFLLTYRFNPFVAENLTDCEHNKLTFLQNEARDQCPKYEQLIVFKMLPLQAILTYFRYFDLDL